MRYLHGKKAALLGRVLMWALLITVTAAGATGWAHALYFYSNGSDSAVALDGSQPAIRSVFLNLGKGRDGADAKLTAGTMVTVRHGGGTLTATAQAETIREFLERMEILPAPMEMVGIETLKNSVVLTISDHLTVYERVTESAKYETVYRDTAELPLGEERVVRAGRDGQRTAIYEQTWVNGTMVSRQYVEEISTTTVDEIVERGTAVKTVQSSGEDRVTNVTTHADGSGCLTFSSGKTLRFSKALTMTATAYTVGHGGVNQTTATGSTVRRGVAAVDKKVIPLGSYLYIVTGNTEYGLTHAEDTGVKGQKIDLYMETYQDCINFGRQTATVYLLEGDGT